MPHLKGAPFLDPGHDCPQECGPSCQGSQFFIRTHQSRFFYLEYLAQLFSEPNKSL